MLRYVLRRMLWVFPGVLGVSILSFFVLSLVPSPQDVATRDGGDDDVTARRERFADLPRFANLSPSDVRSRAAAAIEALVASEPQSEAARSAQTELLHLGGAALPVLLPGLDGLAPEARVRLALALAPLAERMGLHQQGQIHDPEQVVLFWNRFWEARGIEFRASTARTAVLRYSRHGTEARAEQLRLLDTYALPFVIEALAPPRDPADIHPLRRLVDVMSQVSGRPDRIADGADVTAASACVERWQRWWLVYHTDFVHLTGVDRVAAIAVQTQYGKWVHEALWLRMGRDAEGRPMLEKLLARAKHTFTVLLLAIALAYLIAVLLGSLAAWHRRSAMDRLVCLTMLLAHAATPAVLATAALVHGAPLTAPMVWATGLLALVLVAEPTLHQRSQMSAVLMEDYVRAAVARGAGPLRVLFVHGLRNAMLPLVTRAALELPLAVTACFVLEKAFAIPGLGEATLTAVAQHDVMWLMALAVGGAVLAVTALVVTDVGYALVEPRLRNALSVAKRGRR